jgi:hypothetical protein
LVKSGGQDPSLLRKFASELHSMHLAFICRFLAAVINLNLCIIVIEFCNILQEVELKKAWQPVEFGKP